jgi:phosphatidylinositol glycan class S
MNSSGSAPQTALELFTRARDALTYSSRAFFNPGMVGQLYFPAEHKYAIYMLFAPASMPLIVTLIKELRSWRKSKKDREKVE